MEESSSSTAADGPQVWTEVTDGDLGGWTPESRAVYLEHAERLLPQGWVICDKSDASHGRYNYAYCDSAPGARFSWVAFFSMAERRSLALWQVGNELKGTRRFAHGGIVSLAFDHALIAMVIKGMQLGTCVTLTLTVKFIRPVPVEAPFFIEGTIDKVEGRKYYTKGEMRSPDGKTVYATCTALYFHLPEDKVKELEVQLFK